MEGHSEMQAGHCLSSLTEDFQTFQTLFDARPRQVENLNNNKERLPKLAKTDCTEAIMTAKIQRVLRSNYTDQNENSESEFRIPTE